jgi:hypothetical protein
VDPLGPAWPFRPGDALEQFGGDPLANTGHRSSVPWVVPMPRSAISPAAARRAREAEDGGDQASGAIPGLRLRQR